MTLYTYIICLKRTLWATGLQTKIQERESHYGRPVRSPLKWCETDEMALGRVATPRCWEMTRFWKYVERWVLIDTMWDMM